MLGTTEYGPPEEVPDGWEAFQRHGVLPDLEALHVVARAITPPKRVRRFDTRFFAIDRTCVAAEEPGRVARTPNSPNSPGCASTQRASSTCPTSPVPSSTSSRRRSPSTSRRTDRFPFTSNATAAASGSFCDTNAWIRLCCDGRRTGLGAERPGTRRRHRGGHRLCRGRRDRPELVDPAAVHRDGAEGCIEHAHRPQHRDGRHQQHLHRALRAAHRGALRRRTPADPLADRLGGEPRRIPASTGHPALVPPSLRILGGPGGAVRPVGILDQRGSAPGAAGPRARHLHHRPGARLRGRPGASRPRRHEWPVALPDRRASRSGRVAARAPRPWPVALRPGRGRPGRVRLHSPRPRRPVRRPALWRRGDGHLRDPAALRLADRL